ncbi:MAG TPA: polysaccharide biosynthesis/export family protein [Vicinamibacterales bacterium]|nr:polysaccharide biosynthesis/export family protein [Vicinamibacterales bacterium]
MLISPRVITLGAVLLLCVAVSPAVAEQAAPQARVTGNTTAVPPADPVVPPDYVIGPDDVLNIVFWREKDMSGDVTVRPDGRITLPLINEIVAAGLTPEELRKEVTAAADKLMEEPTVAVVVKEIRSRKVFITGQVSKPGPYPLMGPTTVLQLIATAGGVLEYADEKNISIMRIENGKPISLRFNYKDVKRRRNLGQNITLKPGDTIVVP